MKVSEKTLERASRVMAGVLAVLERRGTTVEISEQGGTTASFNGERVFFEMEEPIRRVVTQKPRVPNPTDRWDYDEIVTHEAGGRLALVIHSAASEQYKQRARWSDTKVRRVVIFVGDFVAGLMKTAIAQRHQAEERKKREAEEQKRQQERAQLQKDIQEEEKKLEQFNKWVDLWERAERLRRFISAYAEKCRSWPAEDQPKYQAWTEWATKQADRLDPFVWEKPASVLDRKHELPRW